MELDKDKRSVLEQAMKEALSREYVAWLNLQVANAQVECLRKFLAKE